jgi:hypothetical protein
LDVDVEITDMARSLWSEQRAQTGAHSWTAAKVSRRAVSLPLLMSRLSLALPTLEIPSGTVLIWQDLFHP